MNSFPGNNKHSVFVWSVRFTKKILAVMLAFINMLPILRGPSILRLTISKIQFFEFKFGYFPFHTGMPELRKYHLPTLVQASPTLAQASACACVRKCLHSLKLHSSAASRFPLILEISCYFPTSLIDRVTLIPNPVSNPMVLAAPKIKRLSLTIQILLV